MSRPPVPGITLEVLQSLAQHRLLSTGQVHAIHTPHATRRRTQQLLAELERGGLAGHVRLERAVHLWHITEPGAVLLRRIPEPAHQPPKVLTAEQAAGQLWRHTLAVNDVGIAYLRAARRRGDEFGALSWRHEVAHRLGPPGRRRELVVADALLTYLVADEDGELAIEYRFLELDRATLAADRLVAKLARYARLHRERDQHGEPSWRGRYLAFPAVLVVLAGQPRRLAERRRQTVALLCASDPELERTPDVAVSLCLLADLTRHGPFAPIHITPEEPERPVDWLGEADGATSRPTGHAS